MPTSPAAIDTLAAAPPTDQRSAFDRYPRQTIFGPIGRDGQRRVQRANVVLIGCGALGSGVADALVRAGVGHLTIVDRDYVELSNLQRQSLFEEADVEAHTPKAVAAADKLGRVNAEVRLAPIVADVNPTNAERLARDADLIVDGTDNFETRYLLNDVAVKLRKPWVYGGVIGSYGMTMTIRPGVTSCLRCVFPEPPPAGSAPTCDTAGVLGPAVGVVSSLQAAEVLKLIVGDEAALNADLVAIDVWRLSFDRIPLRGPRADCRACGMGEFDFLDASASSQATVLCGHDAVQVRVQPPVAMDLGGVAERLRPIGDVLANPFLVRFRERSGERELTIFADGRAIVKGTTDPSEARTLYARYVGA